MQSGHSADKHSAASLTIFANVEELLEAMEAAAAGLQPACEAIRKRGAPPDGLNRPELPMSSSEAAALLGISVTTLKRIEAEIAELDPEAAVDRTHSKRRQFYSWDLWRFRHHMGTGLGAPGSRPHVVAVANQKGGVAKTTTTINLVQDAATRGYRVLLIDLDPQASATASMLVDRGDGILVEGAGLGLEGEHTCAPVLKGEEGDIRKVIRRTHWPTIDIIPSSPDLVESEFDMIAQYAQAFANGEQPVFWQGLKLALDRLTVEEYDLVVIDTSPTLNLPSLGTLLASDGLLIPCPMRSMDVESLKSFHLVTASWFRTLAQHFEIRLRWFRVLPTLRQSGSYTEDFNEQMVRQFNGTYMLPDRVPKLEALQRATGGGSTVFEVQKDDDIASAPASARKARNLVRTINDSVFAIIQAASGERGPPPVEEEAANEDLLSQEEVTDE